MAGNYGFNAGNGSSPRRLVHVLRGFNGCDPTTFTRVAPVADNVTIYSGQIMSLDAFGKWTLGQSAPDKTCYIALSNSDDTDVSASGLLPGLSCAGQFEIETPWFESGSSYVPDLTRLIAEATKNGNVDEDGGLGTSATIIGKITRAPYKLNDIGLVNSPGAVPAYGTAKYPFQSNEQGVSEVLTFITTQD